MASWWEQTAAIPSFDDALQAASFFFPGNSFDNNLQFMRDVHTKLHTKINQG